MESLRAVFRGDIETNGVVLEAHSTDASMFKAVPSMVVFPKDAADIGALIVWTEEERKKGNVYTISARSAGTCMSGGSLTTGIMVDVTRYMNDIISWGEDTVTVQPGCYFRDLEKELTAKQLFFPPYPASHHLCALGGMFSNNCAGEKTLRFGKFEQWIVESKVVLADGKEYAVRPLSKDELDEKCRSGTFEGNLYRSIKQLIRDNYELIMAEKPKVSKNSSGYYLWNVFDSETGRFDLNRLLVGSQGTLGIITEMTIRTHPVEQYSGMIVYMMRDLERLGDLTSTISQYKPTSIESFDDTSLGLAFRYWTDFLSHLGIFRAIGLALRFIPELGMLLRGGIPKLILMVEVTGMTKGEVARKLEAISSGTRKYKFPFKVMPRKQDAEKYWIIRQESFNLLRKHLKGKKTAPFIDDVVVPVETLPKFLPELRAILDKHSLEYTIAGHAGNGNFHVIPLMNYKDPSLPDKVLKISDEVFGLVKKYKGSLSGEHNDGIIRTPYLSVMFSDEMLALFEKTKKIFDSHALFNPGKKVGGTKEDIHRLMKKE